MNNEIETLRSINEIISSIRIAKNVGEKIKNFHNLCVFVEGKQNIVSRDTEIFKNILIGLCCIIERTKNTSLIPYLNWINIIPNIKEIFTLEQLNNLSIMLNSSVPNKVLLHEISHKLQSLNFM